MATVLVHDTLWGLIEPLLPIRLPKPQGGRPRLNGPRLPRGHHFRAAKWHSLADAAEGCGSGMTCWRRLRDWQQERIWDLIHFALLNWLSRDGQIDWSRVVVDSCSVRAVFGGSKLGQIRQIGPNVAASAI